VNFFHRTFARRSKNDGKSWHPLWKPVPVVVFCVFFFGFRAANQNVAASKQQTSLGTIGQCEHRGRGNENYCHYTFPVGDEQYTGVNRAALRLISAKPWWFTTTSKTPESTHLKTSPNKVARISVSSTSSC
jgi:hypothetical protein